MSIADELAGYAGLQGPVCRIAQLATGNPSLHRDLVEAFGSAAPHAVVARWWNATRSEKAGWRLTDGTVSRHRAKACVSCR